MAWAGIDKVGAWQGSGFLDKNKRASSQSSVWTVVLSLHWLALHCTALHCTALLQLSTCSGSVWNLIPQCERRKKWNFWGGNLRLSPVCSAVGQSIFSLDKTYITLLDLSRCLKKAIERMMIVIEFKSSSEKTTTVLI